MFDPQGTLRDVPQDQVPTAIKAGGVPAVRFQAPEGDPRFVPATRVNEAVKNGGKILPFEQQDMQHPGFWAGLGEDLLGMAKHPEAMIPGVAGLEKSVDEWKAVLSTGKTLEQQHNEAQKAAGYPGWYRYLATPAAEGVGVNVSGMENSAAEGNIAGVAGHAVAVPTAMAITDLATRAVPGAVDVAKSPTTAKIAKTAVQVGKTGLDVANSTAFDVPRKVAGKVIEGAQNVRDIWRGPLDATKENVPYAGEPQPESAAAAQSQTAAPASATAGEAETPKPRSINLENHPITGEGAVRKVLAAQGYDNLMKIAKSRGINVTQEAQLKPGVADPRLINKIVDDFSDDELDNFRSTFIENTRMGYHNFGEIGPEAWKTFGLQTYFPDVKIPQAVLNRVGKAVSKASPSPIPKAVDDLTDILHKSLAAAKAQKAAQAAQ